MTAFTEEWIKRVHQAKDTVRLVPQERISENGKHWHRAVFTDVQTRLTDPDFPCIFSKNAFRKGLLKFIFVEDAGSSGIRHLAEGLTDYVEMSNAWDGRLDSADPLIVAFARDAVRADTIADYHAFGWRVLQDLHAIDPAPWPEGVDTTPHSDSWSMCFNGMPLFCNMSSPAHVVRRSRNLGAHFVIVINPRERFDVFAGETPSGRKVRSNIRNRIGRYDGTPHALQLGSYGGDALEWTQYGLVEENVERTDTCPFLFRSP